MQSLVILQFHLQLTNAHQHFADCCYALLLRHALRIRDCFLRVGTLLVLLKLLPHKTRLIDLIDERGRAIVHGFEISGSKDGLINIQ